MEDQTSCNFHIMSLARLLHYLFSKLTCVKLRLNGLALENKKSGINAIFDMEAASSTYEPDVVACGHLMIEASILPI